MIFIIHGYPGSGKTQLSYLLNNEKTHIIHLDPIYINYIHKNKVNWNEILNIIEKKIEEQKDNYTNIVVEGFFPDYIIEHFRSVGFQIILIDCDIDESYKRYHRKYRYVSKDSYIKFVTERKYRTF